MPEGGFAYSPNKATEFVVKKSEFTPKHVSDFIAKNSAELQKEGNYIGGWEDDGNIYLDVSRLEKPSPDVIRKAQGANQLAVYDVKNRKTIDVGRMENGVYTPLDEATNVFNRHKGEVTGANPAGGASGKSEVQGGRTRDAIAIKPTATNVFVERQRAIAKGMSSEQKGRFLDFRNKASEIHGEFADSINQIQGKVKAYELWEPNLKSDGRAIEKAFDDLAAGQEVTFENIKDMNRAAFTDADPEKLADIFTEIEKNFDIVRAKNRIDNPQSGYRDILINVRLRNGTLAEIQLQLPNITKAKELEHITYEQIRAIEGKSKNLSGDPILTRAQKESIVSLKKKMEDAYNDAWREEYMRNPNLMRDLRPLLDRVDSYPSK